MGKFIRDNITYIKFLCRKAWEKMKRFGGAFLNNVFVDYRNGSIWYDTEEFRLRLVGYKIAKKFRDIKDRAGNLARKEYWALVECPAYE